MNKRITLPTVMLIIYGGVLSGAIDDWEKPAPYLRYNEVCFLTAHNSFASKDEGFVFYAQQKWTMLKQLENGVRALTIDTHDHYGEIVLCHGKCGPIFSWQLGWSGTHKKFSEALETIVTWLKKNPEEIVTLFIKNHTNVNRIHQIVNNVPHAREMILTRQDGDPEYHGGFWPRLSWMIENNKRLVIFVESPIGMHEHPLFWHVWEHVIENQPGVLKTKALAQQRPESLAYNNKKRTILLFNFFGNITLPAFLAGIANHYKNLSRVIYKAIDYGLTNGKMPNFINLDFVNRGNAMRFVNELNEIAADAYYGE